MISTAKSAVNNRYSGIELLKIIAMFLIVLSHVTQTLGWQAQAVSVHYAYKLSQASTDWNVPILAWFRIFGAQGNLLFFICSAWFLVDSRKVKAEKIFHMLADVWVINALFLTVFLCADPFSLSYRDVKMSLLPTSFALNWYITCYILLYLIHVELNYLLDHLSQQKHLAYTAMMILLYVLVPYLKPGLFFVSALIEFIVIYFTIAYLKKYLPGFCSDKVKNKRLLLICFILLPCLILLTNYLGLNYEYFRNELLRWGGNTAPILLLTAIAAFNLCEKMKFVNVTVNSCASLLFLVYFIHENYLVRIFLRPRIWGSIIGRFGQINIIVLTIIYSVGLFVVSILLAYLYKAILQTTIHRLSEGLLKRLARIYSRLRDEFLNLS